MGCLWHCGFRLVTAEGFNSHESMQLLGPGSSLHGLFSLPESDPSRFDCYTPNCSGPFCADTIAGHLSPAERAWMKEQQGYGLGRPSGRELWQLHNHDLPDKIQKSCNRSGQVKDQRTAEAVVAAHDRDCHGGGKPLATFLDELSSQLNRLTNNPASMPILDRCSFITCSHLYYSKKATEKRLVP